MELLRELPTDCIPLDRTELKAGVYIDTDSTQILSIVFTDKRFCKRTEYEIRFNVMWIKDEGKINWLATVLADDLRNTVLQAQRNLQTEIKLNLSDILGNLDMTKILSR